MQFTYRVTIASVTALSLHCFRISYWARILLRVWSYRVSMFQHDCSCLPHFWSHLFLPASHSSLSWDSKDSLIDVNHPNTGYGLVYQNVGDCSIDPIYPSHEYEPTECVILYQCQSIYLTCVLDPSGLLLSKWWHHRINNESLAPWPYNSRWLQKWKENQKGE